MATQKKKLAPTATQAVSANANILFGANKGKTSASNTAAGVSLKPYTKGVTTVSKTKKVASLSSNASAKSKKADPLANEWMQKAVNLYKQMKAKENTDALFDRDYFDPANNPELEDIFKVDLKSATPLDAAKNIDVMLKYQAGVNYRAGLGKEYNFNDHADLYAHNDTGNQNLTNNWLQKIKEGDEQGIRETLDYWKKGIDSATDNSDYKKRLSAMYDDLYTWAGNNYSSFATMELNDYDTQIARNNIRIRELGAYNNGISESDATAAQTALSLMLSGSGDPIATVQNNKDLRRITDYDNLAKQHSDPYELGDAIIDSLMDFSDRAGSSGYSQGNYDEYIRLLEENDSLRRGRAEVEERRNSLLEREKYASMPGTSTSNTSLSHFHPEPYEVATRYSRRNMETGENESFYEYNAPTLAQMVADPEGVWEKYQQASAHSSVTGSANDIDLVMRMTDEERDNYKKVYAGYGEAEADKYFDVILRDKLNARQTQQLADEYAANAKEHPVASYIGSLANNLLGQVGDIANAGRIALGMDAAQNQFGAVTDAQRGTVLQNVADATSWANFNFLGQEANPFVWLLQGVTAAADEGINTAIFGPLKNVWMGLTAGSKGAVENYERYGDRGNALLSGLGTAVSEYGSEWLGDKFGNSKVFSKLDDLDTGLKKAGYLAKGTIIEGIEEGLSNSSSAALDTAAGEITGVGSEIADRVEYLRANGYTGKEAWGILLKEYAPEVLQDAIIGAIAGFGMSGSNVAATTAYDNSVNRKAGSMIQQQGNVAAVLREGLKNSDEGVRKISQRLINKLNLEDPNQDVLPNDPETKAELDLVQEAVSEADSSKQLDQEKQEKHQMRAKELKEAAEQKKQNLAEKRATPEETKEKIENLSLTRRQKRQVGQVYRKVLAALDVDVEARRTDLRKGIEERKAELAKAVDEKLRKLGERPIEEVSEAIAAVALGDPNVTIDQLDIAEAYAAREGVVKELWDAYSKSAEKQYDYAAATGRKLEAASERASDALPKIKENAGKQMIGVTGDISYTTDEGETITGKLESFAPSKNGEVAAVVDGKIVEIDRLEIGDEGRDKLFRYAAELRNADAANAMYEGIEEGQDVESYASGFEAAYHYGEIGIDIAKAKQRATVDMLTPKQFESAYVAGASAAAARPKTVASKVAGKISFADGLDQRLDGLDANQKGAISVMRRFAEVGSVNIEFFESQANAEGSYTEYENGSYNPDTNTIRIDINAGKNKASDVANYAMLRVASHELTHYIKAQNAEAYQKLQDFVVEHLSAVKNTTFDALVELKMQQQPKLSYEAAVEEVVADGSEMMLKNSTVIQQLAAKDKSLFQRIRDWLRDFAKNVQAAFRGVSARSAEARLLQNVKGMQKLWDNALLGAIENVRSAQTESRVAGIKINSKTQTASIKNSRRSLEASEYAKNPDKMAASLAKAVNVSEAQAKRYIKNMFSIGKIIAGDQTRLDYEGNPLNSVLKDNAEYKFTVDMSTLCAKRLVYTGTLDAIQKAMPNTVLTSEDLVELRKLMMDRDYEVACGICYVESRRRELGSITKGFVDAYNDALASGEDMMLGPKNNRHAFPTEGGNMLTLADVNTTEGIENIQLHHPKIYAAYMKYMNSRGVSKPKLIETRTDYRGEILQLFDSKRAVNDRNENGGLRIQSFSDFEVVHLIDMMQVITDMAQVGLAGQAYTKVPDFAEAMGRTGLKINLSLIAKGDGVDADGKLIFDDIEGMPADDAFRLRKKYSKNVGTILVGKSDEHIRAALADPRIDFVIPFHKSGWSESLYAKLGLQNYSDYTNFQNERAVTDPDFKWDHSKSDKENYAAINKIRDKGRHIDNMLPMDYWDFSLSGEENARNYLEACYYDGRLPKFPQFVNEPGYWKLLIDFKMYDNNGVGSPQLPVKPDFNMTQARRMLKDYNGGHAKLPVAQDVVDDFVKQYNLTQIKSIVPDHVGSSGQIALANIVNNASGINVPQVGGSVKYSVRTEQTDTEAFRRWFGDSKVVNADGSPKVMYHGTSKYGFTYFDTYNSRYGLMGYGSYFTDNPEVAEGYTTKGRGTTPGVYSVYLSIQNPIDMDAEAGPQLAQKWKEHFDEYLDERDSITGDMTNEQILRVIEGALQSEEVTAHEAAEMFNDFYVGNGFDGIAHIGGKRYSGKNGPNHRVFIAFEPNQIKSATDNIGTFDPNKIDIRYSLRTLDKSERELLLDVADSYASNDTEREFLQKYKGKINDISQKREELRLIRSDIRDLQARKDKTRSIVDELARQKNRANLIAEQINNLDNEVITIISSGPMQKILRDVLKAANEQAIASRNKLRENRTKTDLRNKIKGLSEDFNRRLRNPTSKKYIPTDMVNIVIEMQKLVDTRSGKERNTEKLQSRLAAIKEMYDRYQNDSTYSHVFDKAVSDMLGSVARATAGKTIYDLGKEELKTVYNAMRALRKQVTESAKLKSKEYNADMVETGTQMYRETQEAAPMFKKWFGDSLNWQLTPDKFFSRLAGFKKDSAWDKVAKSFSNGTEKMLEIQREAYYHFRKWTESKEFDKLNSISDKNLIDIGLKDANGNAVKITRGMMLEVYMHLSSEDNRTAMMYGGFSVPNLKKYYAGKVAESYGTGSVNTVATSVELARLSEKLRDPDLTEEQAKAIRAEMDEAMEHGLDRIDQMRKQIENKLTAWDRELIEAVHEWNDVKSRNYINDVTLDMYDIKRAQVDNYYPIHRDKAFVNAGFDTITRNMNLENWGALKDRVPSRAPILLGDLAFTVDTSVKQTSKYVGYVRAQRDFNKLYNVRIPNTTGGSVKKIVAVKFGAGKRVGGVSGEQYIENYIGSITGSREGEGDVLSIIRRNLPRATMSLNFRVGFSQISALPKAAVEVGWKNLASGMMHGGTRAIFSKKAREELAQNNVWFWQRYLGDGGQREFADAKGGRDVISRAWNWVDDKTGGWLLNLNQKVDVATTAAMWSAAEAWVSNNTGHIKGSDAYKQAVTNKYTDILRNTQAANTVSERSDLARSTSAGNSILTMYKSEAFANFNILYDSAAKLIKYGRDLKAGKNGVTSADLSKAKWRFANAITSVVFSSSLLNAGIKLLVNAIMSNMSGYRDDDDEITKESVIASILKEMGSDFAGMFAFAGQIYDFVSAAITKDTYYAPSFAALDELTGISESAINFINDDEKTREDYAKLGSKLFFSMCNVLGVPAKNGWRQLKGMYDTFQDIGNGEFLKFESSVDRSTSTNIRRLVKAELTGDKEKWNTVYEEIRANYFKAKGEELSEKDFISDFKSYITKEYKEGNLTKEEATKLLKNRTDVTDEDDIFWWFDERDYAVENGSDEGYSKDAVMKEAVSSRSSAEINEAIAYYMDHGYSKDDSKGKIRDSAKELYFAGEITWDAALKILLEHCNSNANNYEDVHVQYWLKREWDYAKANGGKLVGYSKYSDFYAAVENGKDASEFVKELFEHSKNKKEARKNAMSSIGGRYREDYIDAVEAGDTEEAQRIMDLALDAYVAIGLNREAERRYILKNWKPKK